MSDIIFHHYPTSPFSEKVRIAFGIKGIGWSSVIVPVIMPKPDLMPLTGGYRKTPVLQIGADIWCDTQAILRELDRRFPEPSLLGGGGLADIVSFSLDRQFFAAAVGAIFGHLGDKVPETFRADRAKFSGRDLDPEKLRAAVPQALDQLRAWLGWVERALEGERAFLFGDAPGIADLSLYHCVWFLTERLPPEAQPLSPYPLIEEWRQRMAAFGHGTMTELDPKAALAIAKAAEPAGEARADAGDPAGRRPGDAVTVAADDTGRDPVSGRLVSSSANEIVIEREDAQIGRLRLHFPRAGFMVCTA